MGYERGDTAGFYNAYGEVEWERLEKTAYGRLQALRHTDFIQSFVSEGDRVLDAGSGPGRFAIEAAARGATVTLMDTSSVQLGLARTRVEQADIADHVADYVIGDIVDLSPFEDASFDVVMCFGGALSYVMDRRPEAADELVRVLRPAGYLLASVMSRYGAVAALVRRGVLPNLENPGDWHVWQVIEHGDLPGFPSDIGLPHPGMHLYSAAELMALFEGCMPLRVAGCNVTTVEGSPVLDEISSNPDAWSTTVELERRLSVLPGMIDVGSHIVAAFERVS